jgi:hypothetical protein
VLVTDEGQIELTLARHAPETYRMILEQLRIHSAEDQVGA